MPRGREELRAYLQKGLENIDKVGADEPWSQIRFPRYEARKRIKNESKSKRIVFVTDEQNYKEFWAMKEAYMRYCSEDPTRTMQAIIAAMGMFDLKTWLDEQQG